MKNAFDSEISPKTILFLIATSLIVISCSMLTIGVFEIFNPDSSHSTICSIVGTLLSACLLLQTIKIIIQGLRVLYPPTSVNYQE